MFKAQREKMFNPLINPETRPKLKEVVYVNVYEGNLDNNLSRIISEKLNEVSYITKTRLGIDNIFYDEKFVEVIVSDILGHEVNTNTRGPDAYDNDDPVEYKSINLSTDGNKSFQFHWISNEKFDDMKHLKDIYFVVRHNATVLEIWRLPARIIIADVEPSMEASEVTRVILGKKKNINTHKSYSLKSVKEKGAKLVYKRND